MSNHFYNQPLDLYFNDGFIFETPYIVNKMILQFGMNSNFLNLHRNKYLILIGRHTLCLKKAISKPQIQDL
jgi:hypothetical protein